MKDFIAYLSSEWSFKSGSIWFIHFGAGRLQNRPKNNWKLCDVKKIKK